MKVTLFKNVHSTETAYFRPVEMVLARIKDGNSQGLVESIRESEEKSERNEYKKQLPAICFSGKFNTRADNAMAEHSGLICLDFDDFESNDDMLAYKEELRDDPFVYSVFISPSGNGLKVLVKIPADKENHRNYFRALQENYDVPQFDKSCKNESRVCYESYDPDIYINPDSELWEEMVKEEVREIEAVKIDQTIHITEEQEIIDRLMIWWEKKYGFIEGERNNNLLVLVCALCNYGIPQSTTLSHVRYICSMDTANAPYSEIKQIVRNGYKTATFGNKAFENTRKVDHYVKKLKSGENKKEIVAELITEGIEPKKAKEAVKSIEQRASEKIQVFWNMSDKGIVSMNQLKFKHYMADNGFYKYYPEGSDNFVFVRRKSNLIHNTMEEQIKDYTLDYLEDKEDSRMFNFFAEKTKYFKYDFLSMIKSIDIETVRDTISKSHLFYRNCVVIITKDSVECVKYTDFNHWVWADQVIDRDFEVSDSECDFKTFISDLGSDEADRINSIESTVGYLLHGYKDPKTPPAVILNDEVISDNPEGGTGKGLFVKAISKLKNTAIIDGKSFDPGGQFAYQTVKPDTQVLSFDDVKQKFDFEKLFSVVTEDITLNYKFKTAITIPFDRSPKIVVTTNYAIAGEGHSHDRRKWELEFSQFYNKNQTPVERLGKRLFDEWDEDEWLAFDNYMIKCLQLFLDKGLIKSKFKNLKQRKFHSETCKDFADWVTDKDNRFAKLGRGKMNGNEMFVDFIGDYPDFTRMKRKTFYQWIDKYGEYEFGLKPERSRSSSGVEFEFKELKKKSNQKSIEI
jgi:hypothetical protein